MALTDTRRKEAVALGTRSRSLRAMRVQARLPRMLLMFLMAVLCIAGLRAIINPPQHVTRYIRSGTTFDYGASAFAQSFTSAYLTWQSGHLAARDAALTPYISQSLGADGGLHPAGGTSESVRTTQVAQEKRVGGTLQVLVVARTTAGTQYLDVPIARDARGMLYVASYPALVGPPASDTTIAPQVLPSVDDASLRTVVERALGNYLSGQGANLRADLTPSAVVSLPSQPLTLTQTLSFGWVTPKRSLAVQVEASDRHGNTFTLTYQLDVVIRDRWYVQSIQFDPTLQGGS